MHVSSCPVNGKMAQKKMTVFFKRLEQFVELPAFWLVLLCLLSTLDISINFFSRIWFTIHMSPVWLTPMNTSTSKVEWMINLLINTPNHVDAFTACLSGWQAVMLTNSLVVCYTILPMWAKFFLLVLVFLKTLGSCKSKFCKYMTEDLLVTLL